MADKVIEEEEEEFRIKLERFRVDIVQTLDLERQFVFSFLRSKSILDEEDCERILNAGAGRQQKVAKFLDVLACKGPEGYKVFVESLEIEHPNLYHKMTGKRAANRTNPLEVIKRFTGSVWAGGPAEKEMVDFDRQYLATQLEKTTTDLQALSHFHNKVVSEKNVLERKVLEATGDLENQQMQVQDLREQLRNVRAQSLPGNGQSAESAQRVQRYIQELMAENADKSNRIITLQQSLLDAVEKSEKDRVLYLELQQRHEEGLQQLRDLTINYDFERRNSRKMSEKMRRQVDQIRQGEDLRREIFELKLKLSEMQEQRDEARDELREFRNVTEALNAKFDSVHREKEQALEFKEEVSGTVLEMNEEIQGLQIKLQEAYLDLNDLKRKNMRLTQESKTLREQRNCVLQEREVALNERNIAMKERNEAVRMNQDLQKSRDESFEAQLKINKELHEDYTNLHEEMDVVRHDLRIMTEQYEMLQLKLRQEENVRKLAPFEKAVNGAKEFANSISCDETDSGVEAVHSHKSKASVGSNSPQFKPFPWRKSRTNSAILSSAYRRIQEVKPENFSKHRASMPAVLDAFDCAAAGKMKDQSQNEGEGWPTARRSSSASDVGKQFNERMHRESQNSNLKIDIKAARALSRSSPPSPNPSSQTPQKEKDVGEVLSAILPCISDFSLQFAMKSGSQESLNKSAADSRSSPVSGQLKSPDPRKGYGSKSVSPKLLFRVKDQIQKSAFIFSVNQKPGKEPKSPNDAEAYKYGGKEVKADSSNDTSGAKISGNGGKKISHDTSNEREKSKANADDASGAKTPGNSGRNISQDITNVDKQVTLPQEKSTKTSHEKLARLFNNSKERTSDMELLVKDSSPKKSKSLKTGNPHSLLDVAHPRRRHSSADLTVLEREEAFYSDV